MNSAAIELLESEEETVNTEAAHSEKVEDLFESARQAFFSDGAGHEASLPKQKRFTQVKSYDGPIRSSK